MTPGELAALHARAFPGPPRPWTAVEFTALLAEPSVRLFVLANAFLLARRAGPEAEVLTLCTAPEARRRGAARALLAEFENWARTQGIAELFLEVAESNTPARALYDAAGYTARGHRKDYYTDGGRRRVSALVLGKAVST